MKNTVLVLLAMILLSGCGHGLFPLSEAELQTYRQYKRSSSNKAFMDNMREKYKDPVEHLAINAMESPCDDPLFREFEARGWNSLTASEQGYYLQRLSDCDNYRTNILIAKEINDLNSGQWARFWTPVIAGLVVGLLIGLNE